MEEYVWSKMAGWGSLSSYDKSWYTLHTVFFVPEATKVGKNVNLAVGCRKRRLHKDLILFGNLTHLENSHFVAIFCHNRILGFRFRCEQNHSLKIDTK